MNCLRGRYCKVLTDVDTETMKLKLKTLTGEVHEVDVEDTNATVKDVKVNNYLELLTGIIRICKVLHFLLLEWITAVVQWRIRFFYILHKITKQMTSSGQ